VDGQTRGVLFPAGLPTFHRMSPPPEVADLVRWFWIPEWDIEPGRVSRQQVIAYPACNLVVEPAAVALSGPTTRLSSRELTGRGWAVGALLRPAAVPALVGDVAALVDGERMVDLPDLHATVSAAITADTAGERRRSGAVAAFAGWLAGQVPPLDEEGRLANAMVELVDTDRSVVRVAEVASRLGISVRTLQRLSRRYVGLPPASLVRRRRLQEAAERLRTDPDADLAAVAVEFGYADHAHLTGDFRTVLGFTPSGYRGRVTSAGE
jgi:AraC-like DNA-binding protein